MSLSERLRAGVECAPWVIAEVERLEAENAALRELMNTYNLGGWTDSLELIKERDALRAALQDFDALIKHQYTGSQEAMSDLTYAAQQAAKILKGEKL